jgi:hypothetical protein
MSDPRNLNLIQTIKDFIESGAMDALVEKHIRNHSDVPLHQDPAFKDLVRSEDIVEFERALVFDLATLVEDFEQSEEESKDDYVLLMEISNATPSQFAEIEDVLNNSLYAYFNHEPVEEAGPVVDPLILIDAANQADKVANDRLNKAQFPGGIMNAAIDKIANEIAQEARRAATIHAPFNSPHEASSVIREEFEELWDHVKADTGLSPEARKEAIQLAAMGLRYVLSLIDLPSR